MSFQFNSLVLIPSDHCNITCRHCAPECGPKLKHVWDVELLRQCITDAAKIPSLEKSVHFAGGEPFLYFKQMLDLCQHAKRNGFVSTLVTNGFWGKNKNRARDMFLKLAEADLIRVELSTDVFHQEYIPMAVIENAIEVLKELGIGISLRVITTRKHPVDETIAQLPVALLDGLEIMGSPVVPTGRALTAIESDEYYLSDAGAVGCCDMMLNLTVRPDGGVFPCCAGSEQNPSLALGNIRELPIDVIVRNAERNLMVKRLVHSGPASFFPILEEAGLAHKIDSHYTNICHLCTQVFADAELVEVIAAHMFRLQRESLVNAMRSHIGHTS
jgi:MoaA/NifB/PqqE/SkfB family radical SAM enzyme